jgi:hypothetical protein
MFLLVLFSVMPVLRSMVTRLDGSPSSIRAPAAEVKGGVEDHRRHLLK